MTDIDSITIIVTLITMLHPVCHIVSHCIYFNCCDLVRNIIVCMLIMGRPKPIIILSIIGH